MPQNQDFNWNLWLGVTILIFSIVGIALVPHQVLETRIGSRSITFSPSTFPYISLSLITFLAVILIAQNLGHNSNKNLEPLVSPLNKRVLIPIGVFLFYVILIEVIGMFLATLVSVALIAFALGNRNWLTITFLSSLTSICIWIFFGKLLLVYFPEGTLFEGLL